MKKIYETERLIVRHWEEKDYLDLYDYAKDKEITKFLSWQSYTSVQEAIDRITHITKNYEQNLVTNDYAIELKKENKVIGSIAIHVYNNKNEGSVEIGYVLNTNYQGYGYMTEALQGMFKFIKLSKIAKRIVLKHDVLNTKSGNVMKRAGMTFEGVMRKAGCNNFHSRADIAVYSILDEEIDLNESNNYDKTILIYTDGACSGNPGPGGWGSIIFKDNNRKEISGYDPETTNNQMELISAIKALELIEKPSSIILYSDSAYLINAFEQKWIDKWLKNGFRNSNGKEVANLGLWKQLIDFNNKHRIKWMKVKGHADNEHNNRCDELATGEIAKNKPKVED